MKTNSIILTILLVFPLLAKAQDDQNSLNQQDWLIRNQQNILEESKREREFQSIEKQRKLEKAQKTAEEKESFLASGKPAKCAQIKEIRLIDAKLISAKEQKKLTKKFLNQCFSKEILEELVKTLSQHYQARGYITTQITVPKQNIFSGILELKIIEGKIEEISFQQNGFRQKLQKFMAFGNPKQRPLNIHELNQGIYQINRLQSNSAALQIIPGSADGLSKIDVANQQKFPLHLTLGKDNLGNSFSGIQKTNLSVSLDNGLSLNDNINLNYSTNLHDDPSKKRSNSFSSGISLPFKFYTFSYDHSHSDFLGQVSSQSGMVKNTGFSKQNKFGVERTLLNHAALRIAANTSLTTKHSANYQNDVKQTNSERKLSIANVGFTFSSQPNNTTNIYLKPSYSRGLKILNANKDLPSPKRDTARAQFEAFKLYGSISKKFTIPKIEAPVSLTSELDSQFSNYTLYGSEQFSVGGYYSVRGFRENYIAGSSGYYLRNKLNFNLGSAALPLLKNSTNLSWLNKISLEPFYDYGYAKIHSTSDEGRMSGAGIKTIFSSRYFNASATYSWAVNKSKLASINSPEKENRMIYFELSASCC